MSGTINKVILIGHLGDDVKMHYFNEGGCVGRFPLATNESYTNKQTGERVTNTDWHNVVVKNKAAEICEKYLKKGDKVYIEGKLKTRQWTGEDGNPRYTTEVQVQDFTFLTPPKGQGQMIPNQSNDAESTPMPKEEMTSNNMDNEMDDLPF